MTASLSDESFDELAGCTDSELLFQMMVTNGLAIDATSSISDSLIQVERLRREDEIAEPFRATLALTDGTTLWALRSSSDHMALSLFFCQDESGVLVVSESLDGDKSRWHEVSPDTLVTVRRNHGVPAVETHESFLAAHL